MKKDKGNSAKFSEGMGGVSTENNIDTAPGSPPPKGEGRAGAKAPERGVPPRRRPLSVTALAGDAPRREPATMTVGAALAAARRQSPTFCGRAGANT